MDNSDTDDCSRAEEINLTAEAVIDLIRRTEGIDISLANAVADENESGETSWPNNEIQFIQMGNDPRMFTLEEEEQSNAGVKKCRAARRIMKKSLPHIGLFLLMIGYICIVAITYYFIEGNNEKMERIKLEMSIEKAQQNLMTKIQKLAPRISIKKLQKETAEFGKEMFKLGRTHGRLGAIPITAESNSSDGGNQQIWNWANCLLFACSLIARIGFGHLFPVTTLGKLLICPFVVFGVPLFLVSIADVGKFLSDFLCFLNIHCQERLRKISKKFKRKNTKTVTILNQSNIIEGEWENERRHTYLPIFILALPLSALLATIYFHLEGWLWLDSFYFVIVTFGGVGKHFC